VGALVVLVVGEDGDGQLVIEEQLGEPRVHVHRPLDEHVARPQRSNGGLDQPGAGRAVMAHSDDVQGHARGYPGRRWRAP
jgi:hypothetical protein